MITSADEKRVLDLVPTGLYIKGVWRDASDGKTFAVPQEPTALASVQMAW